MKLKNLLTLGLFSLTALTGAAQITASSVVKINLNVNNMPNPDCWLNQGSVTNGRVYMHSGLCTQSQSFCDNNIVASGSLGWEHIRGNWGMDDGVGLMTNEGTNKWSITFTVYDYYSNNISAGSTAMAPGATPYMIGLVFRDQDGTYEGKDVQCNDIFIRNLQTTPEAINSSDLTGNTAVSLDVLAGLDDATSLGAVEVYPNPSSGQINLEYFFGKNMENVQVKVMNMVGQEVADLFTGNQPAGTHRIVWDGMNQAGSPVSEGMYLISISAGNLRLSTQKVMISR